MAGDAVKSQITVTRASSSLHGMRLFIRDAMRKSRLNDYDRGLVSLAVDEVIAAMVENAGEEGSATIRVRINISNVGIKVEIDESENRFSNGLTGRDALARVQRKDNRREIAIYFICEIMDEIYYTYQKGFENRLVLVKFIN